MYVVISDCNIHDAVAVHLFQRHLVEFLKTNYNVMKMIYFSDGCAGQYKNCKNFINLCHHYEDFGLVAEWHFFATSHGKGPPDGVGGTVKREAAKASLQRVHSGHITTPLELFTFCQLKLTGTTFKYLTSQDWGEKQSLLSERLSKAKTIAGTQKLPCFLPLTTRTLQVKEYSTNSVCRTETVDRLSLCSSVSIKDAKGYVAVIYDSAWWVGYVLKTDPELQEVTVTFLHPHGPNKSFSYPDPADVLTVHISDLLISVDLKTYIG